MINTMKRSLLVATMACVKGSDNLVSTVLILMWLDSLEASATQIFHVRLT